MSLLCVCVFRVGRILDADLWDSDPQIFHTGDAKDIKMCDMLGRKILQHGLKLYKMVVVR